jgi:ketosteroid isomerase-like protein
MMKLNAQWDAAINDPNFDALLPMYAADANLMPPGSAPVSDPTAIRDFFAKRGTSVRNHKLELVEIVPMGDCAYVTSRFKASLVRGDQTTTLSGSTVKLYEHQSNGEWKVRSDIFVREWPRRIIDFLSRPSDHRLAPRRSSDPGPRLKLATLFSSSERSMPLVGTSLTRRNVRRESGLRAEADICRKFRM